MSEPFDLCVGGRTRGQWRARCGFTLVELMVVIAVIALLIALILPAMQQARDVAKRAICASNMHQMGLGTVLYAEDFGEWGPYLAQATNSPAGWRGPNWQAAGDQATKYRPMQYYFPSPKVFNCPTDTIPTRTSSNDMADPIGGQLRNGFVTASYVTILGHGPPHTESGEYYGWRMRGGAGRPLPRFSMLGQGPYDEPAHHPIAYDGFSFLTSGGTWAVQPYKGTYRAPAAYINGVFHTNRPPMHGQQPGANYLWADQRVEWRHMELIRERFRAGMGTSFGLYW